MTAPILIFDSGVGGLSVVRAMRARWPGVALAYACDNAAMPYGLRPDRWLVSRIVAVCRAAVEASGARALVVACNTASTLALPALRVHLGLPVVGTVPAIKPAAAMTRSGVIGLLATSATVSRPYTERLIADFAGGCTVLRVAADALVGQAEKRVAGGHVDPAVLDASLAPLWAAPGLDTVVLGCTHFPLLGDLLAHRAVNPVRWVDSGAAIARRVGQVLGDPAVSGTGAGAGPCWTTAVATPGLSTGLQEFGFHAPRLLIPAEQAADSPGIG